MRHGYDARLPEDAPAGTRVAALETTDADLPPNDRLRYFLEGDGHEDFTIDKVRSGGRVPRGACVASHLSSRRRATDSRFYYF